MIGRKQVGNAILYMGAALPNVALPTSPLQIRFLKVISRSLFRDNNGK